MMFKRLLFESRWGAMSLIALYISLLSGLVLAWQYDPATPFYSTSSIDLLIPYGLFLRSLHFYSSQLFFLLSLLHFLVILIGKETTRLSRAQWIRLTATLPTSLLLLFTGYVLRADATGESAGLIAENIARSIPLFGDMVNSLLFAISEEGMKRVYVNHLVGFVLLWLVLAWDHLRRYRVRVSEHGGLLLALCVPVVFLAAPMEPMGSGVYYITGPWFFLGLQELLRVIQPFWAGCLFPLLFLAALALLGENPPWRGRARIFACIWLLLYVSASLIALSR